MKRWLALALALVLPGAALAQPLRFPAVDGLVAFALPGTSISCLFMAAAVEGRQPLTRAPELACERRDAPAVRVVLGPVAPALAVENPGEPVTCCGGVFRALPYGQGWVGGPFSCGYSRTGLRCRRTDGHGFALSRHEVRLF